MHISNYCDMGVANRPAHSYRQAFVFPSTLSSSLCLSARPFQRTTKSTSAADLREERGRARGLLGRRPKNLPAVVRGCVAPGRTAAGRRSSLHSLRAFGLSTQASPYSCPTAKRVDSRAACGSQCGYPRSSLREGFDAPARVRRRVKIASATAPVSHPASAAQQTAARHAQRRGGAGLKSRLWSMRASARCISCSSACISSLTAILGSNFDWPSSEESETSAPFRNGLDREQ